MDKTHTYKVVIVGGGIAGLAAAKTLGELGIRDVLLLEAKDKLGGRILTTELGSGLIELGAQWIHGQDSELYELAQNGGHVHNERSTEGVGEFRTPTGEIIPAATARHVVNTFQSHLGAIEEDFDIDRLHRGGDPTGTETKSVGSYLRDMYKKEIEASTIDGHEKDLRAALWDWKMNFERIDNSCNELTQLSLYRWGEFQDCSGKPYNNFRFGAQAFIDALARDPPPIAQASIKLSCPVTHINWDSSSKSVINVSYVDKDSGGQIITVQTDAILVTVSIGVLKSSMTKDLFHPPLPDRVAKIIEALGFDSITKIFLEWDTPWWNEWNPDEFKGVQLVWPNADGCECAASTKLLTDAKWLKSLQGFDPVLDNRNVLMSWASGQSAIDLEQMDPKQIGEHCTLALRKFMNNERIPLPKRTKVSKWFHDPYTRGAYSYRSTETDKFPGDLTQILTEPITKNGDEHIKMPNGVGIHSDDKVKHCQPLFLLAGEALHPTQYSTLHGAFDSGRAQAQKIAKYLTTD